jgi:hypothetical protein
LKTHIKEKTMPATTKLSPSPSRPKRPKTKTKPAPRPRLSAKNQEALRVLDSFINCSDEEKQDQRETMAFLEEALDDERVGYRLLFPKRNSK